MKQKILIEVSINSNKSRAKVLKTAVSVSGVEAAAFKGNNKNQIEVTGDGIDAAELTTLLRKKLGCANLLTVSPVEEKKAETQATVQPVVWSYDYGANPPFHVYEISQNRHYQSPCFWW